MPGGDLIGEDGASKSVPELLDLFDAAGIDSEKPMAFYCTSGVMATFGLACAEKAGFEGPLMIYDGSWTEWADRIGGDD